MANGKHPKLEIRYQFEATRNEPLSEQQLAELTDASDCHRTIVQCSIERHSPEPKLSIAPSADKSNGNGSGNSIQDQSYNDDSSETTSQADSPVTPTLEADMLGLLVKNVTRDAKLHPNEISVQVIGKN